MIDGEYKSMTLEQEQVTICEAIRAIESDFTLTQIAKLIYNITNERQNGQGNDARAAEIIKSILE